MRRVVVTGRGVQSSIGRGVAAFSRGLQSGAVGIGSLEELTIKRGALIRDFEPNKEFDKGDMAVLDRTNQLAVLSAREAVQESGLPIDKGLGPRAAVVMGICTASITTMQETYQSILVTGRRLSPFTVPKIMSNASAAHISLEFGVTGPAFVVSTACASAGYAISLGLQMVRSGAVDVAVVGGAEANLVSGNLRAWEALRVLAPDTCRPFSKGRRGLVLGEGAATLVLESLDHARARGAPVFGELLGSALNSDANHLLTPDMQGQADAILACLRDADLDVDDLAYVNAHGTGTAANDVTETRALRRALGDAVAERLQVSSTKSMHGHAIGGGAAIEAVATLVALQERFAPPTMNFTEADPDCDLNYVPNEAQELRRGSCALSTSFAFGGHNAVIAMRAADRI
jgi:nodulation protein E